MKPNYLGKPLENWPLQKLSREYRFARFDPDRGEQHLWTRELRAELIRRGDERAARQQHAARLVRRSLTRIKRSGVNDEAEGVPTEQE